MERLKEHINGLSNVGLNLEIASQVMEAGRRIGSEAASCHFMQGAALITVMTF